MLKQIQITLPYNGGTQLEQILTRIKDVWPEMLIEFIQNFHIIELNGIDEYLSENSLGINLLYIHKNEKLYEIESENMFSDNEDLTIDCIDIWVFNNLSKTLESSLTIKIPVNNPETTSIIDNLLSITSPEAVCL